MGYEIFTAMPPALRWGMVNNNQARYHYVAYTKQTGYKDVSKCYASWCNLYKLDRIYMAIWSQRMAATLVACVAETPR